MLLLPHSPHLLACFCAGKLCFKVKQVIFPHFGNAGKKINLKFTLKAARLGRFSCSCHSAVTFGCLEMVMGSSGESPGRSKGQNEVAITVLLGIFTGAEPCPDVSLNNTTLISRLLFLVFLLRYGAVRPQISHRSGSVPMTSSYIDPLWALIQVQKHLRDVK